MTPALAADRGPRPSTSTLLWLAYSLFVIYGSLVPFRFAVNVDDVSDKLARVTLDPLVSPDTGRRVSIPDVVQNLVFFMPFGLAGAVALGIGRRGRSAAAVVIAMGAIFSAGIEASQLLTVDRVTSVSDVCADTIGTAVGVWIATFAWPRRAWSRMRPTDPASRRSLFGLTAATLLVLFALFAPYDFTLDVSTVGGKVRALFHDPWQAHNFLRQNRDEDIVRFALLGGALATWLRTTRIGGASLVAVGGALLVPVILAAAELLVTTRLPGGLGVAAQVAGALGGIALVDAWPRVSRARQGWWLPLVAATIVLMLLVATAVGRPVEPAHGLPTAVARATMPAIRTWILSALTFTPIGFGMAERDSTTRGIVVAVLLSTAVAAGAAMLSWQLASRASLDLAIAAPVGAWLGAVASRQGYRRFDAAIDAVDAE